MHFGLSEDQREIKSVARQFLADRSPIARVREAAEAQRYDEALWHEMGELGWPGISVSEEHGGQGLGPVALAVLLEEVGYACAATPLGATATAAAVIDRLRHRRAACPMAAIASSTGEQTAGIGISRARRSMRRDAAVVVLIDGDDAQLVTAPEAEPFITIDLTRRFAAVTGEGEPLGPGSSRLRASDVRGRGCRHLRSVARDDARVRQDPQAV